MTPPRELTPGEEKSLERIALLRGRCGRYRSAIKDALEQATPGTVLYSVLENALNEDVAA